MRTFVALSLSVGAVRRVAEAVEQKASGLGERGARLAWVPPAQYHVTLQFLGDIPAESVDAIALPLRRRLSDLPPLALRLSGLGSFPLDGDPRVLWVGIDGGKPLAALQAAVQSDLQALGFVKPPAATDLPYHPHLTVARIPEGAALAAADWQSELSLGEDVSTEVVVYESRLLKEQPPKSHRGGVEYHARARVPFSKMR
jgi:RNA 2',3'-cyclic 3'-phosphodiesterase